MKPNKENIDIMTAFFQELESFGKKDKNLFFISADHGAWALANFKKKLKKQEKGKYSYLKLFIRSCCN